VLYHIITHTHITCPMSSTISDSHSEPCSRRGNQVIFTCDHVPSLYFIVHYSEFAHFYNKPFSWILFKKVCAVELHVAVVIIEDYETGITFFIDLTILK